MPDQLDRLLASLGGERRINYTLERFQSALSHVGNPEKDVQSLVIAGTNGKGTTTLLLSSALVQAGFKVTTFLSPHLQHPCERFLLGTVPIGKLELLELAQEFLPIARQFELTYFEYFSLLHLIWSRRVAADFTVLEVGLGGRLDATNVTDPLACAVTNIALDHQEYLGNTLDKILAEKLGVLRPEGLLFTGIKEAALKDQVEKACLNLDVAYYFSDAIRAQVQEVTWEGQTISLNGHPFRLSSPGRGGVESAALAYCLLRIVFPRLGVETLQKGFAAIRNPGRMEIMQKCPRVVLSGDHNPAGIECLKATLESLRAFPETEGRIRILCGFSGDKPWREMARSLRTISNDVQFTSVARARRRLTGEEEKELSRLGRFTPDAKQALESLIAEASPEDTILVTGSLYLVGEVRSIWQPEVVFSKAP